MNHTPSVVIGGAEAVLAREAATELHNLGGGALLTPAAKKLLRTRAEQSAGHALLTHTARETTRAAASQAVVHCGRAAGLGGVMDGGVAAIEAGVAYHRGQVTADDALAHVSKEATTGAAAACIGTAAAIAVVALTGGAAAPTAFVLGAGLSAATKATLTSWWG